METKFTIRSAETKDLSGILLLMKKLRQNEADKYDNILSLDWVSMYGKKVVREGISSDKNFIAVAESAGKVVAFLRGSLYHGEMLWKVGKGAEIYEVFIEKKFRGQRIGSQLMEMFLNWCKIKKIDYIFIDVAARNSEAIKLYKKFGFESNQIVMEKRIV